MKWILGILGDKLLPVLLTIIAGLFLLIVVLKLELSTTQYRLKTAELAKAAFEFSNTALRASVNSQNAAVERMREEAQAREIAGKAAVAKARETAAIYERNAMALMARTPTGDECAATKALLEEYTR